MTRPTDAVELADIAEALSNEAARLARENVYSAQGITRDWLTGLASRIRAVALSETPAIPEAKKLVEWFGRHYGIEGTYPGRGLVEELRLALLAAAPSPNKEKQR